MTTEHLINIKDSKLIFETLLKGGGDNRFVGGCVRNALLNLPIKDIDIATTLMPDEIESAFEHIKNVKLVTVGREHGTIMVVLNGHTYEITTLRKDISTDGRHAIVEYTDDWKIDAERRDFTINSLSYDPETNQLFDYFNGQEDLSLGIIRFVLVPDKRVKEDHLRILRLFRFYTYYGKKIDKESLLACEKYANKLIAISNERKMGELFRIIEHDRYLETLELMLKHGILNYIPPSEMNWANAIMLCKEMQQHAQDIAYKTKLPLRILTLLSGGGILNKPRLIEELAMLPTQTKQYLKSLLKLIKSASLAALETHPYRFLYFFREVLADGFLYLATQEGNGINQFSKIMKLISQPISKFPLTGEDIIKHFRIEPGVKVGKLMESAREIWFESECKASKNELINQIKYL